MTVEEFIIELSKLPKNAKIVTYNNNSYSFLDKIQIGIIY